MNGDKKKETGERRIKRGEKSEILHQMCQALHHRRHPPIADIVWSFVVPYTTNQTTSAI